MSALFANVTSRVRTANSRQPMSPPIPPARSVPTATSSNTGARISETT